MRQEKISVENDTKALSLRCVCLWITAASWCIIPSCSRYLWLMYICGVKELLSCLVTAVISISLLCYFLQTFKVLSSMYKTGCTLASWMPFSSQTFFFFLQRPLLDIKLFLLLQLSLCKNAKVHYIWNTLRITLRHFSPNNCTPL